jgi:uncharacterized protein (TIRG00374 family)
VASTLTKIFRSRVGGLIVRILATVLVFAALFHFLPIRQVFSDLRRVSLPLCLLLGAAYLFGHFLGSQKWRLMVNIAGAGLTVIQSVRCYFAGLFSVLFLPSIVGGDVVRAGLAMRMGRSKTAIVLGGFVDRILDLSAIGLLAACGAVLVPNKMTPGTRKVFLFLVAAATVGGVCLLALFALLPARRFSYRWRRQLVRLREGRRAMAQRPGVVAGAFLLATSIQLWFIGLTIVLANGAGLRLPFDAWLFAWPMAKLSAIAPFTQGGIGVREITLAALLLPFGAPAAQTVAVGLAWEGISISIAMLGGLGSYLLGHYMQRVELEHAS